MVMVVFGVSGNWRICSLNAGHQPDEQDQQADDARQHRPADEKIGEGVHGLAAHGRGVSAGGGRAGRSSTVTGAFACSLICPAATTRSPALSAVHDRDPLAADRAEPDETPLDDQAAVRGGRRRAGGCRPCPASGFGAGHDDEDIVAVQAVDDRGARQGEHLGGRAGGHGDIGEHARQQVAVCGLANSARMVTLREFGADARVDRLDLAVEGVGRESRRPSS